MKSILRFSNKLNGTDIQDMNRKIIKVAKRNRGEIKVKSPIGIDPPKIDSEDQLIKVVKSWIVERNENRLTEKEFSDGKISEWKM